MTCIPLAARDAAVFFHQRTSSPVRRAVVRAHGTRLWDDKGHEVFDAHGNGCHVLGYGHPRLVEALEAQIRTLPFAPRRYTNEPAVALAERLTEAWPFGPARVLFAPSGSDAIEIGLKLARLATGRPGTVAFVGAWHGAGMGALAVGGREAERPAAMGPLLPHCHHVAPPDLWHGPDRLAASLDRTLHDLDALLQREPAIGLMVAEPVPAAPGRLPTAFWHEVRRLLDRHRVLLMFDEVPTGLGRTGHLFAAAATGIAPDLSVVGKSLGGAMLPFAALIGRADLNVAGELGIGHVTHEKSVLGCRVALELLQVLDDDGLVARADPIGASIVRSLPAHAVDAAGHHGAIVAIRLTDAAAATTASLVERLYAAGLNATGGSGRIALSMPLITTDDETAAVAGILAQALCAA